MKSVDKYFDRLFDLNAIQLSIRPETPVTYIMASGREFKDKTLVSRSDIEAILTEIIGNGKDIGELKETTQLTYELPEKGVFSGLAERKNGSFWLSFVLLKRYRKKTPEKILKRKKEEEGIELITEVEVKPEESEIDRYLKILVKNNGSDMHLSANEYPFIRKDGNLLKIKNLPLLSSSQINRLLEEILSEEDREKLQNRQDIDFSYGIEGLARFRVNIFHDMNGTGAVFRLIPYRIPTFEELRLPEVLKDLCFLNKGLVLITGPTGSGKSTTLAAIIDFINRKRNVHIITLEDPIEFVHFNIKALINQREVGKHTHSFSSALRSALREDPDVVLVGEMRDLETIATALETAETGHLVFATLHTTSAYSTVNRIVEQFPPEQQEQIRAMLSDSLKAVISQTLCKKISGGRIAAFEILLITPAVSNLIREGKTYQIPSIIQTRRKEGMVSLNDYLMELVSSNQIETYEAYIRAIDKKGILSLLQSNGYKTDFLSRLDLLES